MDNEETNYICRAKDAKTDEWRVGYLLKTKYYCMIIPVGTEAMFSNNICGTKCMIDEYYIVKEETVSRAVGINDINGVMLFEHDYVKNEYFTGELVYDGGWAGLHHYDLYMDGTCELLGNVIDNPELED